MNSTDMQAGDDAVHRGRIVTCLRAMGRDSTILQYDLLQGGISGAVTYRVHLPDDTVVLKFADAAGSRGAWERSRREALFYRDLARRIPLPVPAVLGMSTGESAGWICLRAYSPVPPIETWDERQYLEIARDLGRFHAAFWNGAGQVSHLPWLRQRAASTDPATRRRASASWRNLLAQPRHRSIVSPRDTARIDAMISHVDRLDAVLAAFPATLCHGDCHHGNLLADIDGRWVWADWQEVGIGPGAKDLSFFLQRARFAGAAVPGDLVVAAYHDSLGAVVRQTVTRAMVQRAIDASELRTTLLLWPPFLSQLSPDHLDAFMRRLRQVAQTIGMDLKSR
ncbi:MAG: hypothetical protein NVS2B16_26310 [Chloroflexota bacterium]